MEKVNQVALYRMCEKNNKEADAVKIKNKHSFIDNETCLKNFRKHFKGEIIVFGDRLDESKSIAKKLSNKFIETRSHGNSGTFNEVLDYALNLDSDTLVYFVEDDYIHRGNVTKLLEEGLERFDYVTLYDHPDKHGSMSTKLYTTNLSHWIQTHSTTMTFATYVKSLIFDEQTFRDFTIPRNFIFDHQLWLSLGQKGKMLGSTVPGFSTHGEVEFTSPVINWDKHV